jgi:hypothetical protein
MDKHKIYFKILPSVSVPDLLTIFSEVMFEINFVLSYVFNVGNIERSIFSRLAVALPSEGYKTVKKIPYQLQSCSNSGVALQTLQTFLLFMKHKKKH